jgi:hypothetical protein
LRVRTQTNLKSKFLLFSKFPQSSSSNETTWTSPKQQENPMRHKVYFVITIEHQMFTAQLNHNFCEMNISLKVRGLADPTTHSSTKKDLVDLMD